MKDILDMYLLRCKAHDFVNNPASDPAQKPVKAQKQDSPKGMKYTNGTAYMVNVKDESGARYTLQSGESVILPTRKNRIQYPDISKGWHKL